MSIRKVIATCLATICVAASWVGYSANSHKRKVGVADSVAVREKSDAGRSSKKLKQPANKTTLSTILADGDTLSVDDKRKILDHFEELCQTDSIELTALIKRITNKETKGVLLLIAASSAAFPVPSLLNLIGESGLPPDKQSELYTDAMSRPGLRMEDAKYTILTLPSGSIRSSAISAAFQNPAFFSAENINILYETLEYDEDKDVAISSLTSALSSKGSFHYAEKLLASTDVPIAIKKGAAKALGRSKAFDLTIDRCESFCIKLLALMLYNAKLFT